MWDVAAAQKQSDWYESRLGSFVLNKQSRLYQRLLADWYRRNHSLLDIGCGNGIFLKMMWSLGFDVTGFDNNEAALEKSRERLSCRADLRLGQLDYLPFEDNSFDYASILVATDYTADLKSMLVEAIRVAERGLLVSFRSKWALGGYKALKAHDVGLTKHSPLKIIRLLRQIAPAGKMIIRSILPFPAVIWKENKIYDKFNNILYPLPFGAWVGIRLDLKPQIPLTGLPLFVDRAWMELQPEAHMAREKL